MCSKSQKEQKKVYTLSPTNGSKEQNLFCCQVVRVFRLSKILLDLVLFCCFLCVFPIRERFVLPKFVFRHEFGLYCFCCALSRSCRYHSKFRRFKPICFLVLFVLVVEMHHSVLLYKKGQQIIYNYSQSENTHKTVQCFHSPTKRQSQQNQL